MKFFSYVIFSYFIFLPDDIKYYHVVIYSIYSRLFHTICNSNVPKKLRILVTNIYRPNSCHVVQLTALYIY